MSVTYPWRLSKLPPSLRTYPRKAIARIHPGGRFAHLGMVRVEFADGDIQPITKEALDMYSPGWRTLYREEPHT